MSRILDFIDDYIFGPLDLITYAGRVAKQTVYQDTAIKFSILKIRKGGVHTQNDIIRILEPYKVHPFAWKPDSQHIHFWIKGKQANWAEYLLLHAGVELKNPLVNPKNPEYVKRHPPGWMPPAWTDRDMSHADIDELDEAEFDIDQQFGEDDISALEQPGDAIDESEHYNQAQPSGVRVQFERINNWLDAL